MIESCRHCGAAIRWVGYSWTHLIGHTGYVNSCADGAQKAQPEDMEQAA